MAALASHTPILLRLHKTSLISCNASLPRVNSQNTLNDVPITAICFLSTAQGTNWWHNAGYCWTNWQLYKHFCYPPWNYCQAYLFLAKLSDATPILGPPHDSVTLISKKHPINTVKQGVTTWSMERCNINPVLLSVGCSVWLHVLSCCSTPLPDFWRELCLVCMETSVAFSVNWQSIEQLCYHSGIKLLNGLLPQIKLMFLFCGLQGISQ